MYVSLAMPLLTKLITAFELLGLPDILTPSIRYLDGRVQVTPLGQNILS